MWQKYLLSILVVVATLPAGCCRACDLLFWYLSQIRKSYDDGSLSRATPLWCFAVAKYLRSNARVFGVGGGCPGLGSAIITVGGTGFFQNSLTCPLRGALAESPMCFRSIACGANAHPMG